MDKDKLRTEFVTGHYRWLHEAASSVNLGEWVLESRAMRELLLLIADELTEKDLRITEYQEEFNRMFGQAQVDLGKTIVAAMNSVVKGA